MKVLKFSGSLCQPCKALSDKLGSLGFSVIEKDIEADITDATRYGIRTIPTMIKIDDNGADVERLQGNPSQTELRRFFSGV